MMNWSITSRTILPMAPAVMILLIRQFKQLCRVSAESLPILPLRSAAATWWPLLPAALFHFWSRRQITNLPIRHGLPPAPSRIDSGTSQVTVWFEGHWGFQYYMEQWKAKPVDRNERRIFLVTCLSFH